METWRHGNKPLVNLQLQIDIYVLADKQMTLKYKLLLKTINNIAHELYLSLSVENNY
jgi:hypothetical protein